MLHSFVSFFVTGWKARGIQRVSVNLKREMCAPQMLHRITKCHYDWNFKHP